MRSTAMVGKVVTGVILLAAAAGVYLLWTTGRSEEEAPTRRERGRVAVETQPVRRDTVYDTGRLSGSLKAQAVFTVAPRIAGYLEELRVDIGDAVKSGDLIAVLDSEEYEQQVIQAEAELDVARANLAEARHALAVAQRDRDRVASLHEQEVASEAELDAAEARYSAALAREAVGVSQVRQREAGLETARLRLSYTRIHASWEPGDTPRVIGERHVYTGTMLRTHDPIVTILDIEHLTAVVHVVERDYPKVAVGQPVTVSADAFPGETFRGTVARVAPLLHESSRQARVEVGVLNPDHRLRPGMFVEARIAFETREDACVIPVSALVRRNGREGVFQIDQESGRVRFVPVVAGIRDQERVQIIEPRLSGEVVTLGHHLLEDGVEAQVTSLDTPPVPDPGAEAERQGEPRS